MTDLLVFDLQEGGLHLLDEGWLGMFVDSKGICVLKAHQLSAGICKDGNAMNLHMSIRVQGKSAAVQLLRFPNTRLGLRMM
jgi:hypothetical protein